MSSVRKHATFYQIGQSSMARKQLKEEKRIKEDIIHSLMPPNVAKEAMQGRGNEQDGLEVSHSCFRVPGLCAVAAEVWERHWCLHFQPAQLRLGLKQPIQTLLKLDFIWQTTALPLVINTLQLHWNQSSQELLILALLIIFLQTQPVTRTPPSASYTASSLPFSQYVASFPLQQASHPLPSHSASYTASSLPSSQLHSLLTPFQPGTLPPSPFSWSCSLVPLIQPATQPPHSHSASYVASLPLQAASQPPPSHSASYTASSLLFGELRCLLSPSATLVASSLPFSHPRSLFPPIQPAKQPPHSHSASYTASSLPFSQLYCLTLLSVSLAASSLPLNQHCSLSPLQPVM